MICPRTIEAFTTLLSAIVMACALSGCDQFSIHESEDFSDALPELRTLPVQNCSTPYGDRIIVEQVPFCELQNGRAEWLCFDGSRGELQNIAPAGLRLSQPDNCAPTEKRTISYKGEIDLSLLQLVQNLEAELAEYDQFDATLCDAGRSSACETEAQSVVLFIDSVGGDPAAAIAIAKIMSKRKWEAIVRPDANCLSSCVFIISGASERLILGKVGIHRIIPVRSNVTTRASLDEQLSDITDRGRALFQENGINPRLIDDMMTIPANRIRILSNDELADYGLGSDNIADQDLDTIGLERACGARFVEMLAEAEALDEQCGGSKVGGDFGKYVQCLNSGYARLGFPVAQCPKSGPKYMCPDENVDFGFSPSFERCSDVLD